MKERVPFVTEVAFYCPECGKKKKVGVEVWITLKKNYFAFECRECKRRWIIDVCERKARTAHADGFSHMSEPQVQFINRITNELQPLVRKEIMNRGNVRIIKSIGKTIGVQPLGEIKIDDSGLFDLAGSSERLGKIGAAGAGTGVDAKIRGLKK